MCFVNTILESHRVWVLDNYITLNNLDYMGISHLNISSVELFQIQLKLQCSQYTDLTTDIGLCQPFRVNHVLFILVPLRIDESSL